MNRSNDFNSGWSFCAQSPESFSASRFFKLQDTATWYSATVPGDVHSDLIRHQVISDPAISSNDISSLWVEKQCWLYRNTLFITEEDMLSTHIEIDFQGLDTYCQLYVSKVEVSNFSNMFVHHRVDVRPFLHVGENQVLLVFYPVSQAASKPLPRDFWINYSTERAYARKAGYHFGWDWTPRICTVGIWRPVSVIFSDSAYIDAIQAFTSFLADDHSLARLTIRLHTRHGAAFSRVTLLNGNNIVAQVSGSNPEKCIEIVNPILWWTWDQGQPHLYQLKAELLDGENVIDTQVVPCAIRTITFRRHTEDGSEQFLTTLNGRTIFSRGANWVPLSNRISSVTDSHYIALLDRARNANMNTLCLWGGGIYEQDVFYRYCDEQGILVWQYFMFACGEYPDYDPDFLANVHDEVEKAVRRLSIHPCVALWIGNVESQMLCQKIGLNRPMYGKKLFEEYIPQWLEELDPSRIYLPSSPWGGTFCNSPESGDRHNWDVWFTDIPYEDYLKDSTLFASEFGVHAAPSLQTISAFCEKSAASLPTNDFLFQYMNRDADNDRMYFFFNKYTGLPSDVSQYVEYSMLIQAEALQLACGHFQKNYPRCGGSLIWQLNDCCPCQSWSLVDYYNRPKASWYYAKQFFSPISVYLEPVDTVKTNIWLINHTPQEQHLPVRITIGDFLGSQYFDKEYHPNIPANQVLFLDEIRLSGRFYPNVIIPNRARLFYLAATLGDNPRPVVRTFEPYKRLLLPLCSLSVTWTQSGVTLYTSVFAKFVHLSGDIDGLEPEDNYFDLLPGQTRHISIPHFDSEEVEKRHLKWICLNPISEGDCKHGEL